MLAVWILIGGMIGGAAGALAGRARICRSPQCNVRANMLGSIVAGVVFGAAVAFYLAGRRAPGP